MPTVMMCLGAIREMIIYPRVHPCPLQTCQCVASFDKIKGELTLWGTFQAPHVISMPPQSKRRWRQRKQSHRRRDGVGCRFAAFRDNEGNLLVLEQHLAVGEQHLRVAGERGHPGNRPF
jgi:hypothetical protein